MRRRWFAPVCILAMLIFGAVVYRRLPAQVPSHWNINGEVDGTSSPLTAILLMPAICTVIWLSPHILRKIDPLGASYSAFESTFQLFINAAVLFLAIVQVGVLGTAIGWDIPLLRVTSIFTGLLFALIGNELGRVQPNWFVGIRTPWTLADPEVWRRTHRVGGRVMFIAGLLSTFAALLLPLQIGFYALLACVLGAAVWSIVYSYLIWRRRHTA
jgi:uncharacterized membrane protein